jgi:hypothetical protein
MAKTLNPPRIELREYDVTMDGWPRKRLTALNAEAAELEYRRLLELRRPNLPIVVTDVTAQRERNNGLTDLEAKRAKEQTAADVKVVEERKAKTITDTWREAEAEAHKFLDTLEQAKQKAQLQETTS